MRFRHYLSAAVLALSCTLLAGSASADIDGARTFVEREHGQIKKLVESNAAHGDVRNAIDGMVDYEELAKRTLGVPCPAEVKGCTDHWTELNDEQHKEVTKLLRQLVEKNYHKNLNRTRDYEISYRPSKEAGENLSRIRTEAKSKVRVRDPAVQVDYLILGTGDRYRVVDIITEGSSMTKNYYVQFHPMLIPGGKGYSHLVQTLKDKIAAKEKEAKDGGAEREK